MRLPVELSERLATLVFCIGSSFTVVFQWFQAVISNSCPYKRPCIFIVILKLSITLRVETLIAVIISHIRFTVKVKSIRDTSMANAQFSHCKCAVQITLRTESVQAWISSFNTAKMHAFAFFRVQRQLWCKNRILINHLIVLCNHCNTKSCLLTTRFSEMPISQNFWNIFSRLLSLSLNLA